MKYKKFGYVRVSSKDQNEARQIEAMRHAGIEERDIFIDKQSGKDFDREQYQLVKQMLREGDILYIHALDRFGRNKEDILNEWNAITKQIKADIVVLDMPLLDTTKYKDSLGTFISDLVLQILSWMAQEERERIRKRQREGIQAAKRAGKKLGRPQTVVSDEFKQIYQEWKQGDMTAVAAMKKAGVSKTCFYKYVKIIERN
ncbi:recombinase family protein [Ectobacillus antri]|uniref:recombinase family protein n=1 Tax=Ectobacillus antri TaxID=2486280 RepID=UPI000F58FFF0|nr:recombinase family protein [Ectobacillus antri]